MSIISPRVLATKEFKKFFRSHAIKSTIRSKHTQRDGVLIEIYCDEIPKSLDRKLHIFTENIRFRYEIDNIIFKYNVPF